MTEEQKHAISECAHGCVGALYLADLEAQDGDFMHAARMADVAQRFADRAFEIAVPTGDHWS